MAKNIISIINERNKCFNEDEENEDDFKLQIQKVLIYTYSIDLNQKLQQQNRYLVHDVVYNHIDLINGIKEAIYDLEKLKQPELDFTPSKIPVPNLTKMGSI